MKIGTKRADGMIFRGYRKNGTEHWVSEESYAKRKAKQREWERKDRERVRNDPEAKATYNAGIKVWQKAARRKSPERYMLTRAKTRAKQKGLLFDLDLADIVIPECCPIFGLKLAVAEGLATDASPELDRIEPSKGYVRGNVMVISRRANRIKNDASPAELQQLATFYANLKQAKERLVHAA
jgi:hypothetical protein